MLISDLWFSSTFSKSSLNIWKFSVHVLLKPSLEDFEHDLASMWNECNCAVVWTFFGIALVWIGMKSDFFQSCSHCWVFQICWHIECSTLATLSFRIWSSSSGTPSPPLALFVVMLHVQRTWSRIIIKNCIPRHIAFKLQKIKDKKFSKEVSQEEKYPYILKSKDKNYIRLPISLEITHTRKEWTIYNCKNHQKKFFREKETILVRNSNLQRNSKSMRKGICNS